VIEKCIEMLGFLHAKIVPTGVGVGFGVGFCSVLQNCKEFHKVLDFQRFDALQYPLQWLCSGFAVSEKRLIFNGFLTSHKSLIFNDFTHLCGAGRGVLYGAKQGCKATKQRLGAGCRVLSKDKVRVPSR